MYSCGPDGEEEEQIAKAGGRKVQLHVVWNQNAESDIAGYRVYRGFDGTDLVQVAEVTEPHYEDVVPFNKHGVYYEITAVNTANLESAHSDRAVTQW
jgi:fibronectin type 3 domain-containing protein